MDGSVSRGPTSIPHGVKRRADDDLRDDQRLVRRLNHLHLASTVLSIYNLTSTITNCNDVQSKMGTFARQTQATATYVAHPTT